MMKTAPRILPKRPVKRIFDLSIVLFLAIFLFPLFIFVCSVYLAVMVFRPEDRGSLFHAEKRYSRGRIFTLYKFRIIKQPRLTELKKVQGEKAYVKKMEAQQDNLTQTGYYIKKFYLDELPQIYNILSGDMTLVGPRPWPIVQADEEILHGEYRKFICWPGLVGPVQVTKGKKRSEHGLDYQYIERYRTLSAFQLFALDLKYIFRGIKTLISAKGL